MAAERPEKIKKEKKEKRSDESGVSKSKKDKKDKKDKKEKKEKKEKLVAALDDKAQREAAAARTKAAVRGEDEAPSDMDQDKQEEEQSAVLERKLVPFAVPLADEKGQKKICKTIRKAAKNGALKRGVKEVVKTLRKSPPGAPGYTGFPGLVIIAGDISPMDVISHIPVLCEDHNVPFIFVSSRAELGAAAKTKRPTSVVMIMEKAEGNKKKAAAAKDKEEDEEDGGEAYADSFASLVKYVQKEYTKQSFWAKGESKA